MISLWPHFAFGGGGLNLLQTEIERERKGTDKSIAHLSGANA